MASNSHGPYDLFVNGHKFQSVDQYVTGAQILKLSGLEPATDFEILMKIGDKQFEPVTLTEKKDLSLPGKERFEVNHIRQLTVSVDDEDYPVKKCFMTPVEILELARKSSKQYYLKLILDHREISYKDDENYLIPIVCKMRFSTCKRGPATVS